MTSADQSKPPCAHADLVAALAVGALPASEVPAVEAHVAVCTDCRSDLERHRAVVSTFAAWSADELQPSDTLWSRLVQRMTDEPGVTAMPSAPAKVDEPDWEEVTPGIWCKILGTDAECVSMLVRLAPGVEYPAHTHAGIEELHLLDGELYIDDRKLFPGEYNRAERGTSDRRVWSETGCTCVLITSVHDQLG